MLYRWATENSELNVIAFDNVESNLKGYRIEKMTNFELSRGVHKVDFGYEWIR